MARRRIVLWASMRPRFANRGSRRASVARIQPRTGFNEAPIRESGKSEGDELHAAAMGRCFNEAPIRESGKCPRNASQGAGSRASMRPRFANRGSRTLCAACIAGRNGFNEAPIRESGKLERLAESRCSRSRFNEAPIRESGKSRCTARPRSRLRGFNEAPIRESGKCLWTKCQ